MFELRIDSREVLAAAKSVGGAVDQIPFVLAGILNDAAFITRETLVKETWPAHVTQRNKGFPGSHLRVEKATKRNLSVSIVERPSSVSLLLHAEGGSKTSVGHRFAIPMPWWRQNKMGPRGLASWATVQGVLNSQIQSKRAVRLTHRGLFIGQHGKLTLAITFKKATQQTKDVPFYEDFELNMFYSVNMLFESKMQLAMSTRRSS